MQTSDSGTSDGNALQVEPFAALNSSLVVTYPVFARLAADNLQSQATMVNIKCGKTRGFFLKTMCCGFVMAIAGFEPAFAQRVSARLDSLFLAARAGSRINGAVLIAENGKVLYEKAFGMADWEKRTAMTTSLRFHLASTSKLFTAVAVLQLTEKGMVKLSDPVVKYLPQFPFANITLRHLITHTSGLPDFELFDSYYEEDPKRVLTNAYVMPAIKRYGKLLFQPGDKWSYSSFGTALLAMIVEKVSHNKFEHYLKKHIWRPSGMQHTYINSLAAPIADEGRVKIYARANIFSDSVQANETIPDNYKFAWISGALFGPGLVVSSTHDLLLFDEALYNGKLLKPATVDSMFTPIKLNNGAYARPEPFLGKTGFGLGWFLFTEDPSRKIVLHTGKQGGLVTVFVRDVTKKQTFIILDNSQSEGLNNLTLNAMRIVNNKPATPFKKSLGFTYARDIMHYGTDFALSHFNQLRPDTLNYYLNLFEMHYVGHELIGRNKPEQGMETLRLLTQIDKDNWYPYFSYGKALLAAGKRAEAAMNLNRAIAIAPGNPEVTAQLELLNKGN